MSLRKLKSMLIIAAVALVAVSCKDDDDDTDIIYMDGTLNFELPEFVRPGQILTLKPKGMSHPDDGIIGYCWKVSPSMAKNDTTRFLNGLDGDGKPSDGSFTHKFSDTLQTYTVYCIGFSEGYTSSSKSAKTTVVSPGPEKSITGSGINTYRDQYFKADGIEWYYATIDELDWFRQDLAMTGSGVPFRNNEAMDGVFGRFYSYEEAVNACPEGWRLPTDADWEALGKALNGADDSVSYIHQPIPGIAGKLMANAYFNDIRMWEYWPSLGAITNESGMGMIPSGYASFSDPDKDGADYPVTFRGVYEYAAYWTADTAEDGKAYYRYLYCQYPDLMVGKADTKTFGASVRCVRNNKTTLD